MRRSLVVVAFLAAAPVAAEVRVPALIGDHMVLQQGMPVRLWGTAAPGEEIKVQVASARGKARADDRGAWSMTLGAAKAGGPYTLTIAGRNRLVFSDVWFGEVWVASGQSNMEFPLSSARGNEAFLGEGCPRIRLFQVPKNPSLDLKTDVDAAWVPCDAKTAPAFSAVALYFGRELARALDVPIGLIHSSWGGTPAEAWTSRGTLAGTPALKHYSDALDFSPEAEVAAREYAAKLAEWEAKNYPQDVPPTTPSPGWAEADPAAPAWETMTLPRYWESAGLDIDGAVWFRRTIDVPASWAGRDLTLSLGPVDDFDVTFVNGRRVGGIGPETPRYWETPRIYRVAATLLRPGPNTIAVRAFDHYGQGGFGGRPAQLFLRPADGSEAPLPLDGTWEYKVELALPPTHPDFATQPQPPPGPDNPNTPTVLFGGMIAPLTPYAVRGVIWYQGEANADRAYEYRTLFPEMIRDWRAAWREPQMPFLFVQLANWQPALPEPGESAWAELREAQLRTLSVEHTGMAVAIDIGETDDIHPKNKADVGHRLAQPALADAYGRKVVPSGPLYDSMAREGDAIRVRFRHAESGLTTRGGSPTGFAVAGQDRKWRWAEARVDGETIVVRSAEVPEPVAVRYGWADNPSCNLYNREDLPASPFRTDDWPGVTGPR
jgi:sialate O-acetylesterase